MDETRLRAVIREEIALAVKTLGEVAERHEDSDLDTVAYDFSAYAYQGACDAADEQRAADAANPFAEPGDGLAPEVKALVQAELLDVLRQMQSALYGSGLASDYSIAERLDDIIAARERAAAGTCDHVYPWVSEGVAADHCARCGAARPVWPGSAI